MNKKICMSRNASRGFTLIELAIVIIVISLLVVPSMKAFQTWQEQSRRTANQQRLAAVQQSLANFMLQYGRLPCPSSFIARSADADYEREVVPLCLNQDGKTYTPDGKGTFAATGRSTPKQIPPVNPDIIIGAVPVRDLGLPDSMREDAWGHLFTYAVSASETTTLGGGAGVIDVVDEHGHSVLPYAADRTNPDKISTGTALYVLVGHGKDGKGAYLAHPGAAVTAPPVPCDSTPGLDNLNCSFESKPASPFAFRSAPFGNQAGSNWFDDSVVFYTQLNSVLPPLPAAPAPVTVNTPPQQPDNPAPQQPDETQLNAEEQQLLQQQLKNLPQLNEQMNELQQELQQRQNGQ